MDCVFFRAHVLDGRHGEAVVVADDRQATASLSRDAADRAQLRAGPANDNHG